MTRNLPLDALAGATAEPKYEARYQGFDRTGGDEMTKSLRGSEGTSRPASGRGRRLGRATVAWMAPRRCVMLGALALGAVGTLPLAIQVFKTWGRSPARAEASSEIGAGDRSSARAEAEIRARPLPAVAAALPADPSRPLVVYVRDWTGAPVTDAELSCELDPPAQEQEAAAEDTTRSSSLPAAEQQSDGVYALPCAPACSATIVARAPGLATMTEPWWPEFREPIEFTLVAAERIAGVVRALDGTPIEGAILQCDGDYEKWHRDSATSDSAGRFCFETLPSEYYFTKSIEIRAEGFVSDNYLVALGDEDAEFVLMPGALICGRVIDATNGAPLAGVRISSMGEYFHLHETSATSAVDGRFELCNAPVGRVTVTISKDANEEPNSIEIRVEPGAHVDLGAIGVGENRPLVSIRGRVTVESDRAPLRYFRVVALEQKQLEGGAQGEYIERERHESEGREDGSFSLQGLRTGWWKIEVRAEECELLANVEVDLRADRHEPLEILIPGCDSIAGRVVDAAGMPVSEAQVYLAYTGAGPTGEQRDEFWQGEYPWNVLNGIGTRADGTFRIRVLPPFERFALLAVANQRLVGAVTDIAIGHDPTTKEVEIRLPPAGALHGRVLDSNGRGLARVRVRALLDRDSKDGIAQWRNIDYFESDSGARNSPEFGLADAYSGGDGGYVLDGLQHGTYTLAACPSGHRPPLEVRVVVEPGGPNDPIDLLCPPGHTLQGRIIDAQGQGLPGIDVWVVRGSEGEGGTCSGPDGHFVVDGLESGMVTITAQRNENIATRLRMQVPSPEVDIVLPEPAWITGRIVGELPDDPWNGIATITEAGRDSGCHANLDASGRFRRIVSPGTYRVSVEFDTFVSIDRVVTIRQGETMKLEFPAMMGGCLEGQVFGISADSGEGNVFVFAPGWSSVLQCDGMPECGNFSFDAVPAGLVSVIFWGESVGFAARSDIEIRDGATTRIELRPEPGIGIFGQVTYKGRPVPDAKVTAEFAPDDSVTSSPANAAGFYSLRAADPRSWEIRVDGIDPQGRALSLRLPEEVVIAKWQRLDVEIAQTVVRGHVRRGGKPIAGAVVTAGILAEPNFREVSCTAGEDGSYAVMLPQADEYLINVRESEAESAEWVESVLTNPFGTSEVVHDIELP